MRVPSRIRCSTTNERCEVKETYMFEGEERTVEEICEMTGVPYKILIHRLSHKWPTHRAVLLPRSGRDHPIYVHDSDEDKDVLYAGWYVRARFPEIWKEYVEKHGGMAEDPWKEMR